MLAPGLIQAGTQVDFTHVAGSVASMAYSTVSCQSQGAQSYGLSLELLGNRGGFWNFLMRMFYEPEALAEVQGDRIYRDRSDLSVLELQLGRFVRTAHSIPEFPMQMKT